MPKKEQEDCSSCNGQGGHWEYGNGQPGKPKKAIWIVCRDCGGSGKK